MIYHGREIHDDLRIKADAVIIGTGAGGAPMGARLAEAGLKVVLLERGGFYTAKDFTQLEDEMGAKIGGERSLLTSRDGSMAFTFTWCVGGSTVHYWADHFRTPDDRMKRWETQHGVQGMNADTMAPFFSEAERMLNVHVADEAHRNRNNQLIRKGTEAMGYGGEWVTQARKDCLGCGFCMEGCAYNRKQSMLVTFVPRALRAGADIYSDAKVEKVLTANGRVTGVEGVLLDRATLQPLHALRVEAKFVILAGGALGSPVVWLRSKLPDPGGWAGKNLFVNPGIAVHGLFDEFVDYHTNIPTSYAVKGFRLAKKDGDRYLEGGYLMLSNQLLPGYTAAMSPGLGPVMRKFMDSFRHIGGVYSVVDDEEPGEIRLEEGLPVYEYRVRGVDLLKCKDYLVKSSAILLAAGAREVVIPDHEATVIRDEKELKRFEADYEVRPNSILMAGPHPMGTLRMGGRPEDSVVNSQGEAWAVKGLYVADASIFPTSISVDPAASIMSRSLMTAENLLKA